MQGKILIVDTIATNRIVLKVKLNTAFYEVLQVTTQDEAVQLSRDETPDLIIAGLDLTDTDGAASLRRVLAKDPRTEHIPVIATACQPDPEARIAALEAGVHEVLYQPVNETLLLGRVRSLIRAHNTAAEWQMREDTCRALGLAEDAGVFEEQGTCVLIGANKPFLQSCARQLRPLLRAKLTFSNAPSVMQQISSVGMPDVFVLILPSAPDAAMRELAVVSTLRANAHARHAGVIVVQTSPDPAIGTHALDLWADDLMADGFDASELALRTKAVMRRKRMGEKLRANVRTGLQAAVFDPLTGLYNRRYAMPHLGRIAAHARDTGRQFAVMVLDLDHFKRINDAYGHAAGDAVLVEVAERLRKAMRHTDMVARIGGEEFMVIMPGITKQDINDAALRICGDISSTPFNIPGQETAIQVTISIGMAVGEDNACPDGEAEDVGLAILAQADSALYAAKGRGRNQVKMGRPAA